MQSLTSIRYVDGRAASKRLATLFGREASSTFPKTGTTLSRRLIELSRSGPNDIVLDFFAGSGSDGCMPSCELNATTAADRQLHPGSARRGACASPKPRRPVADIACITSSAFGERTLLRSAGAVRLRQVARQGRQLDVGFRVLKVDTIEHGRRPTTPGRARPRRSSTGLIDSVKPDRTAEDLLFQVLLDWGLDLALPISVETIEGHEVLRRRRRRPDRLLRCRRSVDEPFVQGLAKREPLRAVFRDAGLRRTMPRASTSSRSSASSRPRPK